MDIVDCRIVCEGCCDGKFAGSGSGTEVFAKYDEGVRDVKYLIHCIATSARAVRERCLSGCRCLVGVTFGASSQDERICTV